MNIKWTAALALLVPLACEADVREQQREQKTFQLARGPRKVIVDSVFGSVEVSGTSGNTVEIVAEEDWRADSNEKLAEAHKNIKLNMTQDADTVKVYVDGPFRCRTGPHCSSSHGDLGYQALFHLQLKVPRDAAVEARTVIGGLVKLENLDGEFSAHNVNGKIELIAMGASGEASTVNGSITASFTKNPQSDERFHTVNGAIELRFQADLSADVTAQTFNGEVYTDFEATRSLPSVVNSQRQGNRYIFTGHRSAHVQFGSGGPKLELKTLNGSISILRQQQKSPKRGA